MDFDSSCFPIKAGKLKGDNDSNGDEKMTLSKKVKNDECNEIADTYILPNAESSDSETDEKMQNEDNNDDDNDDDGGHVISNAVVNDCKFDIGNKYDSFISLRDLIRDYEDKVYVQLVLRLYRKILLRQVRDKNYNADLQYAFLRYTCVHGGTTFRSRSKGFKNRETILKDCPAFLRFGLTKDKQYLIIKAMNLTHNHEISKEAYENLPRQRILSRQKKEEIAELVLDLNVDKRLVYEKILRETKKPVKMKDIHNIIWVQRKAKGIELQPTEKKKRVSAAKKDPSTKKNAKRENIPQDSPPKSPSPPPVDDGSHSVFSFTPPPQPIPSWPTYKKMVEISDQPVIRSDGVQATPTFHEVPPPIGKHTQFQSQSSPTNYSVPDVYTTTRNASHVVTEHYIPTDMLAQNYMYGKRVTDGLNNMRDDQQAIVKHWINALIDRGCQGSLLSDDPILMF